MGDFIQSNQLALVVLCFLIGSAGAILLFSRAPSRRAWEIADLLWVLLGGIGAVTALLVGIYKEDTTRIERQITIAFAASHEFDTDAARFRLHHCAPPADADLHRLCERIEFLSASTAGNSALPLFLAVTERAAPLQGLHFLLGGGDDMAMADEADRFDPAELLVFDPRDIDTVMALERIAPRAPGIAADYRVLALAYDDLIAQVTRLKSDWDLLQANRGLLLLQVIALCLVGFAAPFRLGKSLIALR